MRQGYRTPRHKLVTPRHDFPPEGLARAAWDPYEHRRGLAECDGVVTGHPVRQDRRPRIWDVYVAAR